MYLRNSRFIEEVVESRDKPSKGTNHLVKNRLVLILLSVAYDSADITFFVLTLLHYDSTTT